MVNLLPFPKKQHVDPFVSISDPGECGLTDPQPKRDLIISLRLISIQGPMNKEDAASPPFTDIPCLPHMINQAAAMIRP